MKHHKRIERHLYPEGPLEDTIAELRKMAEGLINPEVDMDPWGDGLRVWGWIPMTVKEREAARKREEKRAAAAAARKEKIRQKELKQLADLKAKYEPVSK